MLLIKNKSFVFLWLSQSASKLADSIYIIGVMTFIYQQTGSAISTALFPFVRMMMILLSSFIAPIVMKRFYLINLLSGYLSPYK